MIVTREARCIALFRLLHQNGVRGIHNALSFYRLEQSWHSECGLRRADLLRTIEELVLSGSLLRHFGESGMMLELTDRGVIQMQHWLEPFPGFRWTEPLHSLALQLQTRRVLARAHERTMQRTPSTARASQRLEDDRRTPA